MCTVTYVSVTTTTEDLTEYAWPATGFSTNGNLSIVDIAQVEVGRILIAWIEHDILCRLTAATTKDHSRRCYVGRTAHIAVCAIQRTYGSSLNDDGSLTAAEEGLTIITDIVPKVTCERLTVPRRIIVIGTTGIVTLTHRAKVSATIDVVQHMAVSHGDGCVAIDLSGCPTIEVVFSILIFFSTFISKVALVRTDSLTGTIDTQTNQTAVDITLGIIIYVTILATAIDSTHDAISLITYVRAVLA